jgi:hypothetical protein
VDSLIRDESLSPIEKVNMLIDEHIERVMQKQCFYKIMVGALITNKNPAIQESRQQCKNPQRRGSIGTDKRRAEKGILKR